jgi:hypothetical protein
MQNNIIKIIIQASTRIVLFLFLRISLKIWI